MAKSLGSHTTVKSENGKQVLTYHSTDVVTVENGKATFNTGSWGTPTTKKKMNLAGELWGYDWWVYVRKWHWYVDYKGKTYPYPKDKLTINLTGS